MRVAILTRTSAVNYGTILQSYALQKFINALDVTALVVDDRFPREIYSGKVNTTRKLSLKEKIGDFLDRRRLKKRYADELKNESLVLKFKKRYIPYYTKDLRGLGADFDIYLAGSDQIWAYAAEPKLFPFFLLESIPEGKIKASYAVSVGESEYPLEHQDKVRNLLNRFQYISVRENSSRNIIKKYTDKEVCLSCDPVLLINREEWAQIAGKRKKKKKYVFCYFLGNHTWYAEKVAAIKERFQCEVLVYQKEGEWTAYAHVKACSPNDFLNYIKFAEYVVTDSFHGFLFSLIFEKQFCLLERFLSDGKNTQNNRLLDLLRLIGCRDELISQNVQWTETVLNYRDINIKLYPFIEDSRKYLMTILQKTRE